MADILKTVKKLVEENKDKIDTKELKEDAKKVGDILKDGKISKEEKKEITNMAKDLFKEKKK